MKKDDIESIYALTKKITDLTRKMEAMGLFTHHRELVSCSYCDLTEDVDIAGVLFVYRGNNPRDVTDIRFIENEDGDVICPECGKIVTQSEDENSKR